MNGLRGRLPSPALIVATTALVVALAGTAIALPGKHTVSRSDLKPEAVRSKQIGDNKVRPQDINDRTITWARVNSDGNLVNASKDGVTSGRNNDGVYAVDFNAGDLSLCAWDAQLASFNPGGGIPSGESTTELAVSSNDTVRVGTHNSSGTESDRGFTLVVFC
jgi:hypothetical protein